MSDHSEKLEDDFSLKCPSCEKGTIRLEKTIYKLPDGDTILLMKFNCNSCSYCTNDIVPLETKMDPGIMTIKITNSEDLNSKIYRSPTGKMEIPELELIVDPGPCADFYFTNVEGVLVRFQGAVMMYKNQLDKSDSHLLEIDTLLQNLTKAMDGQFEFTLILSDPDGGSYILPVDKSKYSYEIYKQNESDSSSDLV